MHRSTSFTSAGSTIIWRVCLTTPTWQRFTGRRNRTETRHYPESRRRRSGRSWAVCRRTRHSWQAARRMSRRKPPRRSARWAAGASCSRPAARSTRRPPKPTCAPSSRPRARERDAGAARAIACRARAAGRWGVTIGVFDGVHRGHQHLAGVLLERAKAEGLATVALTFNPHPRTVLRPGTAVTYLTSLEERVELLQGLGIRSEEHTSELQSRLHL